MKRRCTATSGKNFRLYAGRGIRVCDRWLGPNGYENFFSDMGPRPSPGHSIDRIDNEKGYEPGNCRWATGVEQRRNQRKSIFIEADGERVSLAAYCEQTGKSYHLIASRLKLGWSQDEALGRKVRQKAKSNLGQTAAT